MVQLLSPAFLYAVSVKCNAMKLRIRLSFHILDFKPSFPAWPTRDGNERWGRRMKWLDNSTIWNSKSKEFLLAPHNNCNNANPSHIIIKRKMRMELGWKWRKHRMWNESRKRIKPWLVAWLTMLYLFGHFNISLVRGCSNSRKTVVLVARFSTFKESEVG